jgi:hypothetical protein
MPPLPDVWTAVLGSVLVLALLRLVYDVRSVLVLFLFSTLFALDLGVVSFYGDSVRGLVREWVGYDELVVLEPRDTRTPHCARDARREAGRRGVDAHQGDPSGPAEERRVDARDAVISTKTSVDHGRDAPHRTHDLRARGPRGQVAFFSVHSVGGRRCYGCRRGSTRCGRLHPANPLALTVRSVVFTCDRGVLALSCVSD